MKLFFTLTVAASFLLGLFGGMLAGGRTAEPVPTPCEPRPASEHPIPSTPTAERVAARAEIPGPPAGMDLPPAREGAPPISVLTDASMAAVPAMDQLGPEDETMSARLLLEQDPTAMRAWLPFRWFVKRHGIDTRSLPDDALRALFARFSDLQEQRTAEMIRIAKPHTAAEVESERPATGADPALVDAAEARYVALEDALALEFRGR
jgi:hypothetical protein